MHLFIFLVTCLTAFGAFPKEKDPSEYKYDIDTRYKELVPLLDSATYVAEKYMNRTGFFNLMGGKERKYSVGMLNWFLILSK